MLDDFAHAGACALSNAGARRAVGTPRYYVDDIMVMNIIKMVKISRRAFRASLSSKYMA